MLAQAYAEYGMANIMSIIFYITRSAAASFGQALLIQESRARHLTACSGLSLFDQDLNADF